MTKTGVFVQTLNMEIEHWKLKIICDWCSGFLKLIALKHGGNIRLKTYEHKPMIGRIKMANLWEKVKHTLEQSAKAVKEGAESVAKTVGEKAPQIAATIAEKSKEIAETVSDKTQEVVALGQLKYKHYNLNRDVSNKFTQLGEKAYDLIKTNGQDIYGNDDIKKLIEDVQKLENDIDQIEKEMEEVRIKESEQDVEQITEKASEATAEAELKEEKEELT